MFDFDDLEDGAAPPAAAVPTEPAKAPEPEAAPPAAEPAKEAPEAEAAKAAEAAPAEKAAEAAPAEEKAAEAAPAEEKAAQAAPAEEKAAVATPSPAVVNGRRKALEMELGQLTEKNVGQLKKLNTSTFPVHYQAQFYQDLMKCLDYSRLGFFADILVSSICCRLEDRPAAIGGRALYIMTLSVLKAYQRRSIASQLIRWAVEKAEGKEGQADDIQEIYLHVQTSNEGALKFYKTFGFEVTEEIKNYYKKIEPPDCFVLRKPINGGKLPEVGSGPTTEEN